MLFVLAVFSISHSLSLSSAADDDGEFLLIEAAHCLPKWLRPDNAENRVSAFDFTNHCPKTLFIAKCCEHGTNLSVV